MFSTCQRCNRPLKNPQAQEIGYGKVCAKKIAQQREQNPDTDCFLYDEASNGDLVCRRVNGVAKANVHHVLKKHSPTGIEWGYSGSGPADLALNVLLQFGCSKADAERLHQDFKADIIAGIPAEGGTVAAGVIRHWIGERTGQGVMI